MNQPCWNFDLESEGLAPKTVHFCYLKLHDFTYFVTTALVKQFPETPGARKESWAVTLSLPIIVLIVIFN